jgi:hypothetical protein
LVSNRPPISTPDRCREQANRATGCVLIRYRRYGLLSATEVEQRSFRSIAGACWHHGLTVVDQLVVVGTEDFSSVFLEKP